jgi:signal transduction histidine kinase
MQLRTGKRLFDERTGLHFSAQTLIFAFAVLVAGCCIYLWRASSRPTLSIDKPLRTSELSNWKAFGGEWTASEAGIRNASNERGAKLVTGDTTWRNYQLDTDIQLLGQTGDAGVIIRSTEEAIGPDAYSGYYVGLRQDPNDIFIGRAEHGYFEYEVAKMPGTVQRLTWYHLHVSAVGCEITGVVSDLSSLHSATVSMKDPACADRGRIALRSFLSGAVWRNIRVQTIEPNVISKFTPILVAFCGAVVLLLLGLLMYVKAEHWRLNAVLEERTRVAREIHDTLAQSFSAIAFQLESVVRAPESDYKDNKNLDTALTMARQSRKEAHVTIAALRNLSSNLPLVAVIEKAALQQLSLKSIRFSASTEGPVPPLPTGVETQLFRVAQEAISNAAQHSNASEIRLHFVIENSTLAMTIKDNGDGFRPEDSPSSLDGHYGIIGMRERARAMDAELTISSDRSGSTVLVLMPLPPSTHEYPFHILRRLGTSLFRRENRK